MTQQPTGDALAIRTAQPADRSAIAALLEQLGYAATPAQIGDRLHALAASPSDRVLVATLDGDVVGSISLHALPLFHAGGCLGRITSMVVDERHCGRRVGSALIGAAQAWFDAAGCVKVEVTSADRRADAHRFYERHGFRRDGQRLSRTAD